MHTCLTSIHLVYSKNGLNQIQIPYLRAIHRLDFICLFMALWMELLVLVATDAAIIRTISHCLDAMSGGLIRIYILGKFNTSVTLCDCMLKIFILKTFIKDATLVRVKHGRMFVELLLYSSFHLCL